MINFRKRLNTLSPWMVVPGALHCCMRIYQNTDPLFTANRVAFIEKTPRIRIAPMELYADVMTDGVNWLCGPKGPGGADGERPENQLYGYYPRSRQWCDDRLIELGYKLL